MKISQIKKKYPLSGQEFALWFTEKYRLDEEIFDDAPLNHQIITAFDFLGYPVVLDESVKLKDYEKETINAFRIYELSLISLDEIHNFEELYKRMTMEEIFADFNSQSKNTARNSIKDALVRKKTPEMVSEVVKVEKALQNEENDQFWQSLGKDDEPAPF